MDTKQIINNVKYTSENFGLVANTAIATATKAVKRNAQPIIATAGRFVDNGMEAFLGIKTGVITKPDRTIVRVKSTKKHKGKVKGAKIHLDVDYSDGPLEVKNHAESK